MLTHDRAQATFYESDPLIFRQIAINILLDLHDLGTRLLADAGAINVPTLMLAAGRDWVVRIDAQREFFQRLSSPVKRMHVFPALITRSSMKKSGFKFWNVSANLFSSDLALTRRRLRS
jgi:alpha-beta hydrolase superfamily lysophospholipase